MTPLIHVGICVGQHQYTGVFILKYNSVDEQDKESTIPCFLDRYLPATGDKTIPNSSFVLNGFIFLLSQVSICRIT